LKEDFSKTLVYKSYCITDTKTPTDAKSHIVIFADWIEWKSYSYPSFMSNNDKDDDREWQSILLCHSIFIDC